MKEILLKIQYDENRMHAHGFWSKQDMFEMFKEELNCINNFNLIVNE